MFVCTNNSNHKYTDNVADGFCPEPACYGIGYLVTEELRQVDLTQETINTNSLATVSSYSPNSSLNGVYEGSCRNYSTNDSAKLKIVLKVDKVLISGHLEFSGNLQGRGDFFAQQSGNNLEFEFVDNNYKYKFITEILPNGSLVGIYVVTVGKAKYNGAFLIQRTS